jgi:transcriptional regulator with XRE-family HTH domain
MKPERRKQFSRHFVEGLRRRREAIGMTQAQLAKRLSIGQSALSKIERHERLIDIAQFVAIASALRVRPPKLFAQLYKSFHTKYPLLKLRRR